MSASDPDATRVTAPGGEPPGGRGLGPGAVVGPYTVEALGGHGAFAAVYRAHDATGALVALKILGRALASEPGARARFERERRLLATVSHPHLVRVHDAGVHDGAPWIALAWLDGLTLDRELAARGALAPAVAALVVAQLAGALDALHAVGVVHRDVKASNVILGRGAPAHATLLDLGIAHAGPGEARMTATGDVVGTPTAMAPEQIRGHAVDARTDVYALGILAFQLVTGRVPFLAATRVALEELHLDAPPPPARDRAPVTAAFDEALGRALAKRPADRWPGAGAFARALVAATTQAPPPGAPTTTVRVVLGLDPARADDAAYERLDEALALAEGTLARAGLRIVHVDAGQVVAEADDVAGARAAAAALDVELSALALLPPHTVSVVVDGAVTPQSMP